MSAEICTDQFPALGSTATVAVTDPGRIGSARAAVQRTVAEFDVACSRFRPDSELSAVNAAAGAAVRVSTVLLDAVQAALRAASLTDGDVDPTVGQALVALGYDRDFAALGTARHEAAAESDRRPQLKLHAVPGWRSVTVDRERCTIRVARDVRLDLGATAKALAADRAAAAAANEAGCGVLVGLGGDIALCGSPPAEGWRVRVTDDHRAGFDAPGQWITLRSGGLATSSTTVRRWRPDAHHVLDPATGISAPAVWRTVSVAAGSCLDANIASTASIVRGEQAVGWLTALDLPSRLVRADGSALHLAGWPAAGEQGCAAHEQPAVYPPAKGL